MKFVYTMDINCTREKVWYWLGTPERVVMWQTNISKTEILEQTSNWIGTTFRETIEENGKGVEMQGIITDYQENRSLAMHMLSKYNVVEVKWQIKPMGGYTRLNLRSNIRFKSFLKILSIIFWPTFKRQIQRQLDREYAKLKELCEQN
ncbi:MAG: SRPBCC family protein [Dehalococcoidia bacterium]|nr:MAG: SRPBCC family protein [Dehalococcoidia bacterium]